MKHILSLLVLAICSFAGAQVDSQALDRFVASHTAKENILKEKIFLHTNKTTYFSGEKVWFKAYVVDDVSNLPSYATTNLYVNLYDLSHRLVSSRLFFVENGSAHGEIEIPKGSKSGGYHIETATLWSRNHDRGPEGFNKIDVIDLNGERQSEKADATANESPIEMTFYPESNLFLESVVNTIAVKTHRSGRPISIKGRVLDGNQEEVARFETNGYGLGKFELPGLPEERYTAVTQSGDTFAVPAPSGLGIAIHLRKQPGKGQDMELVVKTNANTMSAIKGRQYYLVVHRGDVVSYVAPLKFTDGYRQYLMAIDRDNLFDGLNEVSVFDDTNTALSHRYVYSGNPEKRLDAVAAIRPNITDSILVDLDVKDHLLNDIRADLSVSVLPSQTLNYTNRKNIYTSFLIGPYLEQGLDYASIYEEGDPDSLLNLSLMTLHRMELGNIMKDAGKEPGFLAETGLSIQGSANFKNPRKEEHRVLLTSKENNIMLMEKLGEDRSFVFDSLHLRYPSRFELSVVDSKGKPIKAGFYVRDVHNAYVPDSVLTDRKLIESISKEHYKPLDRIGRIEEPMNVRKTEQLDEVVLTADRRIMNFDHLLPTGKELGGTFTKAYDIKEGTQDDNSTLFHLIGNMPGVQSLMVLGENLGSAKLTSTRGPRSITGDNYTMLIEINGTIIGDNEILHDIKASDVVEIKVNSLGAGYGVRGGNGVIQVKTQIMSDFKPKKRYDSKYYKGAIALGYASPLTYKDLPLEYQNADSERLYGSIGWFPDLSYNNQGSLQFKVPKTASESIKLIINGMDAKGAIVFKEIDLEVDTKQME